MNELIKRLRVQAKLTRHYCPNKKMKTLEENAADAIEKLQAENERLKKHCKNGLMASAFQKSICL